MMKIDPPLYIGSLDNLTPVRELTIDRMTADWVWFKETYEGKPINTPKAVLATRGIIV